MKKMINHKKIIKAVASVLTLAFLLAGQLSAGELFKSDFKDKKELLSWQKKGEAFVSPIARRKGTQSLLIKQWKDKEQDSYWLSPLIKFPSGKPVKISFWAADNYLRQDDFSYAACLNVVSFDKGGEELKTTDYLISMSWDDDRKWGELWGQLTPTGLKWKYYEIVIKPGNGSFRLKFHWPKPIVRGECYLTDILVTEASKDQLQATRQVKNSSEAVTQDNLRLELSTPVTGNIYYHDDPLEISALVYTLDKSKLILPADTKIVWEVADFQHFELASGSVPFADASPVANPTFYKSRIGKVRKKNLLKCFDIKDPKAATVGRTLYLHVRLLGGGKTLAEATMPYGVVKPRNIDSNFATSRFMMHNWGGGLRFVRSKHAEADQTINAKLGAGLVHYGGDFTYSWKRHQPKYPGAVTFKSTLPAKPKGVLMFNLDAERGIKGNNKVWSKWIPPQCLIDDPLNPGCLTFKIDPYVEYMLAVIRHNRAAISAVVPAGMERDFDARTIELHKKAYTAIKKEFPDIQVGFMIYGVSMNPSTPKKQFIDENLFKYADFIDDHFYGSGFDWTEWDNLQAAFKKNGRDDIFLISTETAIIGGGEQRQRARSTILGHMDLFSHNLRGLYYFNQSNETDLFPVPVGRGLPPMKDQTANFLFMQRVDAPKVSPDAVTISSSKVGRWSLGSWGWEYGGHSMMPMLMTMTYYNLIQNFEGSSFREARQVTPDTVAYVFDRKDATIICLAQTRDFGFLPLEVRTQVPLKVQDMYGRTVAMTPLDGRVLLSAGMDPLTLIFDKKVDDVTIKPITGSLDLGDVARGGKGTLSLQLPGIFKEPQVLKMDCTVDGKWPNSSSKSMKMVNGQPATVNITFSVSANQKTGEYPLAVSLRQSDRLVGRFTVKLNVTEQLRLKLSSVPMTRTSDPAINATIISLKNKPVRGVVTFNDDTLTSSFRTKLRNVPFEVPANGQTTVTIPVDREMINQTAAYKITVNAVANDGTRVTKTEEVGFRACEKTLTPLTIDGDLSDWKLADRTPVPMARKFTNWGKKFRSENDLAADFYTMWDDKYLYFAAVVTDDSFVNESDDINIWQNDNIHIGLYPFGWNLGENIQGGLYREHLGLCKNGTSKIFRVGNPSGGPANAKRAKIAVIKTDTGYIYEWAYPRAEVFPMELVAGKRFRTSVNVWGRDWVTEDGKVLRNRPDGKIKAKLNKLGGLNFGNFLANIDSRPEKWREFMLVE